MRIDIDKIAPLNCPVDKDDCIECGCFELAHDEVICHYSNEETNSIMTREDKELLLKDLCARLPYGVKVESVFINPDTKEHKLCGIEVFDATSILMIRDGLGEFKPYLFPLSSMTEEQKKEWKSLMIKDSLGILYYTLQSYDYLYKNHIDIRGLIPLGLANDATNKNIY